MILIKYLGTEFITISSIHRKSGGCLCLFKRYVNIANICTIHACKCYQVADCIHHTNDNFRINLFSFNLAVAIAASAWVNVMLSILSFLLNIDFQIP